MKCKSDDFPMPVSPTRRMVDGARMLSLDVLMMPVLRVSTSLGNAIRTDAPNISS